jgi:2-C-methyl-D-erythritol 2,4-cyclodiphosphate synthase
LHHCAAEVHREGYRIENIDATIVVQQPKLAPHIMRMRENIAGRLGLSLRQVSVKAKTSEGMGYTGDGSGIAAFAVALLEPMS